MEVTSGAALFYPILYFLDTSGWFAALTPAILCHELGHWTAIRSCGETIRALRLDVTGFCLDVRSFRSRRNQLICTAAGPAAGLCWAWIAGRIGGAWGDKSAAAAVLINCFNLLPALPLDGGRLLQAAIGDGLALRLTSGVTAAMMLLAAVHFRLWGLSIPASLILRTVFTA